jgi:hypothetical protein
MELSDINTVTSAPQDILKLMIFQKKENFIDALICELEKSRKTYWKVLLHRISCPKWEKEFCVDCFGGGLTEFVDNLVNELEIEAKENEK